MSLRLLVAVVPLALAACAASPKAVPKEPPASAIEFMRLLREQTSDNGGSARAGLDNAAGRPTRGSGFVRLSGRWCTRNDSVRGYDGVEERFSWYCYSRGGDFRAGFCRSSDSVLFMADLESATFCSGDSRKSVMVTVVEPTGSLRDSGYIAELRRYGYLSTADLRALREERDEAARLAAEDQERRRLEHERTLPVKRKIGTRVCRDEAGWRSVGFVEAVADEKVQIRIVDVRSVKNSSTVPGGRWIPIVWAYPIDWTVCEWRRGRRPVTAGRWGLCVPSVACRARVSSRPEWTRSSQEVVLGAASCPCRCRSACGCCHAQRPFHPSTPRLRWLRT